MHEGDSETRMTTRMGKKKKRKGDSQPSPSSPKPKPAAKPKDLRASSEQEGTLEATSHHGQSHGRVTMESNKSNGRTLTIRQASEESGLSAKAIARRVERGTLQAVLRDGVRRIPRSELVDAGLVGVEGGGETVGGLGAIQPQGTTEGVVLVDLLDRLERQASELGEMRALQKANAVVTEQDRDRAGQLEAENHELRAKMSVLEQQAAGRRWFRRRQPATV